MNDKAGVSVIICTWNRSTSLHATLLSLNEQTLPSEMPVEVLVVDNNSSDSTREVVERLQSQWRLGDLRYAFEPRQGKQFALNHGIGQCRHAILAFTDDDITFANNWVCEIVRVFAGGQVDLAGGRTLIAWPTSGPPPWYQDSMAAVLGAVDLGDERLQPAPPSYAPAGANLVARRDLFTRIGGFSESHYRHMDFEFGMRSHQQGARIAYEPSILVHAPVDQACLTKRYFRRWAFKAGIARDGNDGSSHGLPLWVFRQVAEDLLHVILRPFATTNPERFSRVLRAWRGIGRITSHWHERLWPDDHGRWVEKHSQKKSNVY